MTNLTSVVMIVGALTVMPGISQAQCVASGEIARVFVPTSGNAEIDVRNNVYNTPAARFTTVDPEVLNAALNAQASHERVTIRGTGVGPFCGFPVDNLSVGGNVINVTVSP